jgi:hypothetical protein
VLNIAAIISVLPSAHAGLLPGTPTGRRSDGTFPPDDVNFRSPNKDTPDTAALDFPVIAGDVVLLESGNPADEMKAALGNPRVLHQDLWSDLIQFRTGTTTASATFISDMPENKNFPPDRLIDTNIFFMLEKTGDFKKETNEGNDVDNTYVAKYTLDGIDKTITYHIPSDPAPVPEPPSLVLVVTAGLILGGYGGVAWRRRRVVV